MNLPMPGSELLALLGFAAAMAFTPGPNTPLSASLAANHGLRHALPFVAGLPVGWRALLWFNRLLALVLLATALWMAGL